MTLASLEDLDDSSLTAQVCIIGAGAAGITLACELERHGHQVLLVEAGGLSEAAPLADYYRGEAHAPHPQPERFRRIAFGGTTGLWGGRCVAFDPWDFERRDWVAHSGWPIGYDEVARYYPRAMDYCDAGRFDFTVAGSIPGALPTIAGFDGEGVVLLDQIERYSLPTDFGKRYRERIRRSRHVTGLLWARCVQLLRSRGGERIVGAELVDRAGRRRRLSAAVFVLATGGLEVPRLLLHADPEGPGLGNGHDLLGRFYMCHFENTLGRLLPRRGRVVFDFERTADGVYCRRQIRFSQRAQQEHRLLNTVFRLHFPSYADARHGSAVMSAIYLAKSFLRPEYRAIMQQDPRAVPSPMLAHVRNVVLDSPRLAKFAFDWTVRMQLARRKLPYTLVSNADGSFPIQFDSEQMPRARNRITLAEDRDRHGLRHLRIAWALSDAEVAAACRALRVLRETLNLSGAALLDFDDARLEERLRTSVPLGGHHLGTARMGRDEREGVVDKNGAVFGLTNLFIASSAVFPTSGRANPTLTIVALSIRLAVHLSAVLSGSQPVIEQRSRCPTPV